LDEAAAKSGMSNTIVKMHEMVSRQATSACLPL
jgi:hypothetical protein